MHFVQGVQEEVSPLWGVEARLESRRPSSSEEAGRPRCEDRLFWKLDHPLNTACG